MRKDEEKEDGESEDELRRSRLRKVKNNICPPPYLKGPTTGIPHPLIKSACYPNQAREGRGRRCGRCRGKRETGDPGNTSEGLSEALCDGVPPNMKRAAGSSAG